MSDLEPTTPPPAEKKTQTIRDLMRETLKEILDKETIITLFTEAIKETGMESSAAFEELVKPKGWKTSTNAPFYKQKFAEEIKVIVDSMAASSEKEPVVFLYEDYPHLKPSTLISRLEQGFLYLVERMDDQANTYLKLRRQMEISRILVESGIALVWKKNGGTNIEDKLIPRKLNNYAAPEKWRSELEEFLETAKPGDTFKRDGLALTSEQCAELRSMLEPLLPLIVFSVSQNRILVGKTPKDKAV